MRRQNNQRDNNFPSSNSGRNNDWNRTNEHFSSERDDDRLRQSQATEYDLNRNSRTDEYDRYGYNRNNDHSTSSDYGRNPRHRESDSRDSGSSFYHNNAGNYGMENAQNAYGARNFDNERFGSSRYGNSSSNSFSENDLRKIEPSSQRSGYYGKGPKGWKRSDERIKEEVCEVLYRDQHIDATNIEVAVNEGVVTLGGTIESRWSKRHAEDRVEHLSGVEDVRNEIRIVRRENSRLS